MFFYGVVPVISLFYLSFPQGHSKHDSYIAAQGKKKLTPYPYTVYTCTCTCSTFTCGLDMHECANLMLI